MVSKVTEKDGSLFIDINGELHLPLAFKSFRPTQKNIKQFYDKGVEFFNVFTTGMDSALGVPYSLYGESWLDDYKYDFSVIDRQIDFFIVNAPKAFLSVMIQLDTRNWWLKKYKKYNNSFWCLSQVCMDKKWRNCAKEYLTAAIKHIEEKYGDRVYCYHLMCGTTTEWLSDGDYEEGSNSKAAAFKKWCKDDNAVIPLKTQLLKNNKQVFLDVEKDADIIKYRKFHNFCISDTILYFSKVAKETSNYGKLVGIYFGYLFDLWGDRLWNAGHLDYERVYKSKYIDLIASPFSYVFREATSSGAIMLTEETVKRNKKLLFLEHDQETYLLFNNEVRGRESLDKITRVNHPGVSEKAKDTIDIMRRNLLLSIYKGTALWWFDMFEGWFYSEELDNELKTLIRVYRESNREVHADISEVAVIAEPNSLYYMNKCNDFISYELVMQRKELLSFGAPYQLFSICDLSSIDIEKYKVFIFLTGYYLSEKDKSIIRKLKRNGKTLFWIYAPDYIQKNGLSIEKISGITGIKIEKCRQPLSKAVYEGVIFGANCEIDTSFKVTDKKAVILGKYFNSEEIAVAYKRLKNNISVYSGAVNVPSKLIREIAFMSGVHVFCDSENVSTYIRDGLIGVYNMGDETYTINVKEEGSYKDLFSGEIFNSIDHKIAIGNNGSRAKILCRLK